MALYFGSKLSTPIIRVGDTENMILQDKTVSYTGNEQVIKADNSYYGLNSVTIEPADEVIRGSDLRLFINNELTELKEFHFEGMSSIPLNKFRNNTGLIKVTVPLNTLDNYYYHGMDINNSAFAGCTNLSEFNFENVNYISSFAFNGCTSLVSVKLSNYYTASYLSDYSFAGCTSLESVDLSEVSSSSLTIMKNCFYNCTNLTYVSLPSSLTELGQAAFYNCSNLTSLNYAGSMSEWSSVTLGSEWKTNSGITTVICSDGTITL